MSSMDRHGDPCIPSPRGPHSRSRLSPLAQPFLPRRRRRLLLPLLLLLVGRRRRPCRPCSRCQTPLPAARSHKDKCAEKSYPAAAAAAQKAAGAGELLYEVLAGGRAGRGRVTGDGRTNAGCVASCEKKGSEQAGEGTNERTNERANDDERDDENYCSGGGGGIGSSHRKKRLKGKRPPPQRGSFATCGGPRSFVAKVSKKAAGNM